MDGLVADEKSAWEAQQAQTQDTTGGADAVAAQQWAAMMASYGDADHADQPDQPDQHAAKAPVDRNTAAIAPPPAATGPLFLECVCARVYVCACMCVRACACGLLVQQRTGTPRFSLAAAAPATTTKSDTASLWAMNRHEVLHTHHTKVAARAPAQPKTLPHSSPHPATTLP